MWEFAGDADETLAIRGAFYGQKTIAGCRPFSLVARTKLSWPREKTPAIGRIVVSERFDDLLFSLLRGVLIL